jgi:DNA adenine methylase
VINSPLRYPGGKAKLFPFFAQLVRLNKLFSFEYCEAYCGGAGLAIRLLTNGFVDRVSINDIDDSIFAFWTSALRETDKFCKLIERTPITVREWKRQKCIWNAGTDSGLLELGFATYFLNRTNRSGIIDGAGPIGGYNQSGRWKIDARLTKAAQVDNLRALAKFTKQIKITRQDALPFFKAAADRNALTYLDPPYFVQGRNLYSNFYQEEDHIAIARDLTRRKKSRWVVSYDDVREIRKLYRGFTRVKYAPNYSANQKMIGSEIIFISDALAAPATADFAEAA